MGWLEFLSTLVWPVVATIALLLFRNPIRTLIENLREVQIGKHKKFSTHKLSDHMLSELRSETDKLEREIKEEHNLDTKSLSAEDSKEGTTSRPYLHPLTEDFIEKVSEEMPLLLIDESWRIIGSELEILSERFNVQNTRDARAFFGVRDHLDNHTQMLAWIVGLAVQLRYLRNLALQAGPDTTPDQAKEFAREANRIANILSQFEKLVAKDQ